MLQMSKHYEPEFKNRIIGVYLEEERTLKSMVDEYGVLYTSIIDWICQFCKEC